ncbi:hypothetical protein MWU58_05235 [Flavobacteriaceae bacterium S0825]|nr:hypothetical protein [Gaetbulibacter sp. S0825]MCK0108685.1 hypothetical protein [Flavobacteriaceae bacterium S0825]NIX64321.1 hypothetical protein [Gaetbulibacter sp. S0825]
MATYKGKIRIDGTGTAISVSVEAGNPAEAKKIIKNQYQVKQFLKQMSRY